MVSPQCDLVAQNLRVPSEQVLLVSGQTVPLIHASWRDHDFVRIDDELHAIKWDLAKIHTWAYRDFTPAKLKKHGLKWFGELRGQYFIQLQRRVLENIGRVGLPTDPFLPFPLECYVFAKGANGKARLLLSYTSEDQMAFGSNAHMVPSGKPKSVHQTVYMFDRQVSFAIAEKLKSFLKSNTLSANTRQQLEVALTKLLEFRNLHTPMTPPEFQEKLDRIVVKKETMRKTKNLKSAISKPILIEIIHPASS